MTMSAKSSLDPPDAPLSHLRTPTSSFRLNQIERIRAHGVGDLVALPQLAVFGDQSVGKSSVLERVTGIPFPRQEGLCTRFPSEITIRNSLNAKSTQIIATIRPHASRSAKEQEALSDYRKVLVDMSELPFVIQEVSRLMGIRGYIEGDDGCAFAPDALRIEITGPTGLHLSVVDLPGLISVATEEQSEDDIDAVHSMITSYLESSRTIILAVVQAGNDMANQAILKLARNYDPEGQRTVGIITKTDLINRGAEVGIALAAKNQASIKLELGFFLLKNPSPSERKDGLSMKRWSELELQFFAAPRWKEQDLDMNRVGAEKLRLFLQHLLDAHIERELPKVGDEMKRLLAITEAKLDSLGAARPTLGHIRSFVTSLSMSFYQLLQAALDGNYLGVNMDFFSHDGSRRLRAEVQQRNMAFSTSMRERGEKRKMRSPSKFADTDPEAVGETDQLFVSKPEMMQWVKEVYSRTRGKELPGNHNSALLSELFLEQSQRWHHLAQEHISSILNVVSDWLDKAVQTVTVEERLRREIHSILKQWVDKAEKSALTELEKLIKDERFGPLTYNHYYTDNVQKERLQSQRAAVRAAIGLVTHHDRHGKLHISNSSDDIEGFITAIESKITVDMDQQACNEAMTQLDAYYKVAMKTFTDNVARQVIERHVISPLPQAFCPSSVSGLSDEELTELGSEPKDQSLERTKLGNEADQFRRSLAELQKTL